MSTQKLLAETTSVPQKGSKPGRWLATLITPGQGSSGFYSEEMLREFGPKALKKGAKSHVTHNRLANGEPDPFQMWGFLAEDAYYEDGVGLRGEVEVLPSWRDKVEEVAPHTALSIYVAGEVDDDGNVIALLEDGQNGVDLVSYPGREGSGLVEKLYESMKASTENGGGNGTSTEAADSKEREHKMSDELKAQITALETLIRDKFAALETQVGTIVTLSESAAEASKGITDAFEVVEEITLAVGEAELPKAGQKRVIESVKAGAKVADAVKAEADYVKAIVEASKEANVTTIVNGRVVEGGGEGGGFKMSALKGVAS
jgi:hypothetical protein